jgi:hypothetical protein
MNEEYKHIAIEATRWCEANGKGAPVAWEWEEKFAELIIRECAALHELRGSNAVYNTGRMHMASDILEYFGITNEQ